MATVAILAMYTASPITSAGGLRPCGPCGMLLLLSSPAVCPACREDDTALGDLAIAFTWVVIAAKVGIARSHPAVWQVNARCMRRFRCGVNPGRFHSETLPGSSIIVSPELEVPRAATAAVQPKSVARGFVVVERFHCCGPPYNNPTLTSRFVAFSSCAAPQRRPGRCESVADRGMGGTPKPA